MSRVHNEVIPNRLVPTIFRRRNFFSQRVIGTSH